MSNQAPEVKIKLTAEDAGVASAIRELGSQLKSLKNQGDETSRGMKGLGDALKTIVAAEVIYRIAEFGKEVFAANLQIVRMSERTGISAGLLSVFGKAAEQSGASSQQLDTALGKLATNIAKFQDGTSKATSSFQALGITQSQFKNLNTDEKIRLVTERLGHMKDGVEKARIAQDLMGKGGQALIPTLNALAGHFDELTAAAIRSGQYMTKQMKADLAQAGVEFAELEGDAKGIATQFEAGLIPALTDVAEAFSDSIEGGGISAFRKLGEEAGLVVKGIIIMFETGTNLLEEVFGTILNVVEGSIKQVANGMITVYAAIDAAVHGHFKAVGQAIADGFKFGEIEGKKSLESLTGDWSAFAEQRAKFAESLFPDDAKKAKRPKPGGGTDKGDDDDGADKARLARREAALHEELALHKAENAELEAENQIAYDRGVESLAQYFERKKALARDEANEQLQILAKERAAIAASPDGNAAEQEAKKQKLAKIDSDITIARVTSATKIAQLTDEQGRKQDELDKKVLGFQTQIAKAQGLRFDEASARIEAEAKEMEDTLRQAGIAPDQIDAMVAKFRAAATQQAQFASQKSVGEDAISDLSAQEEDIRLKNTQLGAEVKIQQLERQRIPELQKIAAAMRAAAITPEQIKAAEDYSRKVDGLALAAQKSRFSMKQFGDEATKAIEGDLSTFLGSTIDQVHGIGAAFRQLAGTVVASIQQMIAQEIVHIAFLKIQKALEKDDNSDSGGGGGGGGGGIFGSLLGLLHFAEGGAVAGPGTATSDSIPAMLSHGEFVVRASAVDAIGVDTLAAINRGMRVPSISGMSIPRFAEGGLVQAGGASSGSADIRLGIGMDEGLILRHLSSKAAGRVVLQHLANNPKAAGKALQRG